MTANAKNKMNFVPKFFYCSAHQRLDVRVADASARRQQCMFRRHLHLALRVPHLRFAAGEGATRGTTARGSSSGASQTLIRATKQSFW